MMEGVQRLETTPRVTLAVLALASGVYTDLGVRELLNGNATVVFFAAVIYVGLGRHLHEMGVDSQVWVHAMETPKERLYFFKRDELLTLKLATQHGSSRPSGSEARKS